MSPSSEDHLSGQPPLCEFLSGILHRRNSYGPWQQCPWFLVFDSLFCPIEITGAAVVPERVFTVPYISHSGSVKSEGKEQTQSLDVELV